MKEKSEFEVLKKKYGENFAKLCRTLFPTILEQEGLLIKLITENFAESHFLYEDIIKDNAEESFKNYIFSLIDVENENKVVVQETPEVLLDKTGYNLYKCETEEEIQAFKKYYSEGEALCTFWGGRLESNIVFFAVKKNVDEIVRKNFPNPTRQDEYGTSVISIQFTKGENSTLSIKNRYNHGVNNPDATFSNNLDNIIPGLTDSFVRTYNLNLLNSKHSFELDHYVKANDGKFYKYNYEINNIYYCPDNVIIDKMRDVVQLDKRENILFDYFFIDMKNKTVHLYDNAVEDSFIDGLKDIKKINVQKNAHGKDIIISFKKGKDAVISLDRQNRIIKYENENITEIKDLFLHRNQLLNELNMPNLMKTGDHFLSDNITLTKLNLPNLIEVGNDFFVENKKLVELNLSNLTKIGDNFLYCNENLIYLNLPNLIEVGNNFLYFNENLTYLSLPNLEKVGSRFLFCNQGLKNFYAPKLNSEVKNLFASNPQKDILIFMMGEKISTQNYATENELLR